VRSSRPRVRVRPLAASRQSVKEREFKKELGTRQQRLPKSSVEGGKGMKKMKENMVTKGEGNMANGNLPVAALVALLVVFVSNQWSRALIYYINNFNPTSTDPTEATRLYANIDIGYDSSQYAILSSFGFTIAFALSSLLAGDIVNRFDRGGLSATSAISWSIAVALGSLSHTYPQLFCSRAVMGLAQGLTTPAAYTLLADLTPPDRIAEANSIFSSGIYIGGGMASLSILLDQQIGWRGAGITVGAFGLLAAAISLGILKDPKDHPPVFGANDVDGLDLRSLGERGREMGRQWHEIFSSKATLLLLAASTVRFMAGFTIAAWKAPLFLSLFPAEATSFGIQNALIVAVAGGTSSIIGGAAADALARAAGREENGEQKELSEKQGGFMSRLTPSQARLIIPIIGTAIAAPLWLKTATAPSFQTASVALLTEYLAAECWFGPALAALYSTLPDKRLRASTQGVFSVLTALGNLAPVLVGEAISSSGIFGHFSDTPIRSALVWSVVPEYALSATLFAWAAIELGRPRPKAPAVS